MFGRKKSAFTLERVNTEQFDFAEHAAAVEAELDAQMSGLPPGTKISKGPETVELPFGEAAPVAARPVTPRPDPATMFQPKAQTPERSASARPAVWNPDEALPEAAQPVLQLDQNQVVDAAPEPSKPDAAPPEATTRRAGRTKTRLLGFEPSDGQVEDVLGAQEKQTAIAAVTLNAAGWLVVVDGPGRGHSMALGTGVSQIGRGDDQVIQLDFGDTSISRSNHASIAFDEEQRSFFLGHGGKANLVRLNGAPVLSTERVSHGDKIRIGETTLQLVAFCGEDFTWADPEAAPAAQDTAEAEAEPCESDSGQELAS